MNKTTIEWTDYTWNPVTGCDKVSAGCRSCYAETLAKRFWGDRKFTDVQMHEDRLIEPEKNRKKWAGKKVFVCSMSDLFHDSVPFSFITEVFSEMYEASNTTFQILTKRPDRALEFYNWVALNPKSNIWLGVSCENQEQANKRIPILLQIPASVRFLSCEPLIGPIDLTQSIRLSQHPNEINTTFFGDKIHWIIAGGESGHNARALHPDWVRSLRDQCQAANVPFFFKQWGEYMPSEDSELLVKILNGQSRAYKIIDTSEGQYLMAKTGKSKSGNPLDGRTHLEFPIVHCPLSTVN